MLDGALCEVSGLCCPSPAIGHSLASPEQLMHLTSSPKRFVRTIGRSEASRFVQATLTQGKREIRRADRLLSFPSASARTRRRFFPAPSHRRAGQ